VVLARPFEGLLLVVPTLIALGIANRSARVWLPILLTGIAGASWFAYDNYRVTGHPLRLPYQLYYQQYETAPPFSFIPIAAAPRTLRPFDPGSRMLETYERARSWQVFLDRPMDWLTMLRYHYGNLLWVLPVVLCIPLLWRSKRTRFPAILATVMGTVS